VEKASTTASTLAYTGSSTTAQIGAGNGTDTFDGKLDEFRLYGRAFTEAEIVAQYSAGRSDELNSGASQAQGGSRLDSGLAGYWKLDDGSGTSATDASTNGNTGTLTNGPTWTTGQIGGAVDFDGANDNVTTSKTVPNSGTVSVWVNTTATINSSNSYYAIHATTSGGHMYVSFNGFSGGNRWEFCYRGNFGTTVCMVGSTYTTNAHQGWHLLTATWDVTKGGTLFLDGRSITSSTSTTNAFTSMSLGLSTESLARWVGKLDEVRLYSRVLSADEMAELYRLTSPTGTDTGLQGYWSFNGPDVSGTTAYDRSGSGNNGTLTNGPTVTPGKVGQALQFDGVNDSVSIADPVSEILDFGTGDFSASAWIKTTESDVQNCIISKAPSSSGFRFGFGSDGRPYYLIGDGTTYKEGHIGALYALNNGSWHHLVINYLNSTDTINAYVDGAFFATDTFSSSIGSISNTQPLRIGAMNVTFGGVFAGSIDEVRIYNRALTTDEISSLYNSGK
jgi:hypothetical protein